MIKPSKKEHEQQKKEIQKQVNKTLKMLRRFGLWGSND